MIAHKGTDETNWTCVACGKHAHESPCLERLCALNDPEGYYNRLDFKSKLKEFSTTEEVIEHQELIG